MEVALKVAVVHCWYHYELIGPFSTALTDTSCWDAAGCNQIQTRVRRCLQGSCCSVLSAQH